MTRGILVVLTEMSSGKLAAPAFEAFGFGMRVARHMGWELSAAAAPEAAKELAELGANTVFTTPGELRGERLLEFARQAAEECGASVVAVNRAPILLDLVPRLAVRLGGSSVMGVYDFTRIEDDIEVIAAIYGGAAEAVYRFKGDGPRIVGLGPAAGGGPGPRAGRTAPVIALDIDVPDRVRVIEPAKPAEGPRLEDAHIVVSGGRGLKDRENYALIRELAAALDGLPGASRAIVDDGWAQPGEQVGLTGKIVSPDLYFAFGISGASQHMAGCSNARTLIAVNTDREAPIFRHAHYGVVGDALELLPELIRLAKQRSGA